MKKYRYMALAAMVLSLVACEHDDPGYDAIEVDAAVNALQTRVSYDADGSTAFDDGDRIRVVNDNRHGRNYSDAVYGYDKTNLKWEPVGTDYVVWDSTVENTFYATYPSTASHTEFTIPADQKEGYAGADWMTGVYIGANGEDVVVNFDMAHRLTLVTVTIVDWNIENEDVSKLVADPVIYSKGAEMAAAYSNGTVTVTWDPVETPISPVSDGKTFEAIIAPAEYETTDRFMTLEVDGQPLTVYADGKLTEGLEPGGHYAFALTVTKVGAGISALIKDWETGNGSGSMKPDFE